MPLGIVFIYAQIDESDPIFRGTDYFFIASQTASETPQQLVAIRNLFSSDTIVSLKKCRLFAPDWDRMFYYSEKC